MCRSSSDEQSRAIDKLPEDMMLFHTTQFLMAEVAYRQERLRRDFQRPGWFQRKPTRQTPEPCLPTVRARHAM
jgi:hypothetical protein